MAIVNLKQGAQQAFTKLNTLWLANTMKTQLGVFCAAVLPIVPDQNASSRPVADWATLLYASQSQMPSSNVSFFALVSAADQLYRLCWIGYYLANAGLITSAQNTALIAAYNAAFP